MSEVPVRELRNNTAALIKRVEGGDEVVITVNGKPAARLVAIDEREQHVSTGAQIAAVLADIEPDDIWSEELRALRAESDSVGGWAADEH